MARLRYGFCQFAFPVVPFPQQSLFYPTTLTKRAFPTENRLILCIEDNALHLSLRKAVLEREGYTVIGATTGDEALKMLRKCPIHAIIADHMLGGTTGAELAREMKQIKPHVPIILFSGTVPQHLNDVDVYVNKGEPTAIFLGIVQDVVERCCS